VRLKHIFRITQSNSLNLLSVYETESSRWRDKYKLKDLEMYAVAWQVIHQSVTVGYVHSHCRPTDHLRPSRFVTLSFRTATGDATLWNYVERCKTSNTLSGATTDSGCCAALMSTHSSLLRVGLHAYLRLKQFVIKTTAARYESIYDVIWYFAGELRRKLELHKNHFTRSSVSSEHKDE